VPIHIARESRTPELVGAGRGQRHDDAGGRACFGPEHKDPRLPLGDLAAGFPDQLAAPLDKTGTLTENRMTLTASSPASIPFW
jgi:hypothetical protein